VEIENFKNEQWKPVFGIDKLSVSNLGRVRSEIGKPKLKKILKHGSGHLMVRIRAEKNVYKNKYLHRLIFEAFVRPLLPGEFVLHKNGVPWDNSIENLKAGDRKENAKDSIKHGSQVFGERQGRSKLSNWERFEIAKEYRAINRNRAEILSEKFKVSVATIRKVANDKRWIDKESEGAW
jgi:hypothetical protein